MNSTMISSWRVSLVVTVSVCVCCVTLAAAAGQAPSPSARDNTDTRWQPWLGCWSATPPRFVDLDAPPQQVCVVPAAGTSAVDVVTVGGSTIVSRERIDANGEHRPSERDGCAGWESAQWSADMRRVYLLSEATCTGGLKRNTTGLMVKAPNGDWIDIVGVSLRDRVGVRVLRHRAAPPLPMLPAEIASAVAGSSRESLALRTLLPLGDAEIIDASRHVNGAVIEAWLAENRQVFTLNASRLIKLADAGVDDRVLDMLVALSYPQAFSIKPSPTAAGELATGGGETSVVFDGSSLLLGGSILDCSPYVMGLSLYGWDGCSPYGYGYYGSRYGFGPYDNYGNGWYVAGGGGGIIVTPVPPSTSQAHGQVVNGRGYVAGDSGSSASGGSSSSGSSSSSSSGGSSGSSGGSSSSSSGGDRTAVPR
jgi:uncharacterized membrane protein YgcG